MNQQNACKDKKERRDAHVTNVVASLTALLQLCTLISFFYPTHMPGFEQFSFHVYIHVHVVIARLSLTCTKVHTCTFSYFTFIPHVYIHVHVVISRLSLTCSLLFVVSWSPMKERLPHSLSPWLRY